jgi:polysaccharide export outer membrane protein
MKVKVLSFFVFALCFSQFAFGQENTSETTLSKVMRDTKASETQKKGYLVGPGDVITTKVLGEPQFDFVATVDEDGRFQVPFFDQGVMAKCRTEKELRADVTQLLSKYLKTPQINVSVIESKSRPPVVVSGETRKQLEVDLRRRATLLDMITLAGGPTNDAGGMIQVFRPNPPMCNDRSENTIWTAENSDGADVPMRLYTYSNLKSGKEESNPEIFPGDLIIVKKALPVYVIGEVNKLLEIPITESGLSLTEAIAQAGGVSREAKTKNITIRRLKDNSKEREIIAVNYDLIKKGKQKDVVLQPDDIIEVDKAKKSIAQTILEIATGSARTLGTSIPQRILY